MEVACQACEKIFKTSPSRVRDGKGKYCSGKCYRSVYRPAHNRKEPVRRICRYCESEFFVRASHATDDRGQFCSVACNMTFQHETAKLPLEIRFWAKVIKTDGCWQWTGAKNRGGYGVLNLGRGKSNVLAHRISWEIHFGPIPEKINALHDCDNPGCTRPDHLFLGTYADNSQDASRKGRIPGPRKLTWEQAREVRLRHATEAISQVELGRQYSISGSSVCNIVNFKTYKQSPVRT